MWNDEPLLFDGKMRKDSSETSPLRVNAPLNVVKVNNVLMSIWVCSTIFYLLVSISHQNLKFRAGRYFWFALGLIMALNIIMTGQIM